MIRNILYSLFLHSLLIIFVYFSFNFIQYKESEKTSKIAISFVSRVGNFSDNLDQKIKDKQPKPTQTPKEKKKKPAPKKIVKPKSKISEKKPEAKPTKSKAKSTKSREIKKKQNSNQKPKKEPEKKQILEKSKVKEEKSEIKEEKSKVKEEKSEIKEEKSKVKEEKSEAKEAQQQDNKEETAKEVSVEENIPRQSFDAKKLENLNLLAREKFNIHNQITRCYQRALSNSKEKVKTVVNLHILIEEDGYINPNSIIVKNYEKYDDPKEKDFKIAVDIAKTALQLCSPLRNLPEGKHEIWRELDLEFDGTNINQFTN
jgi:chemotaxis protein histidine kinase CheA